MAAIVSKNAACLDQRPFMTLRKVFFTAGFAFATACAHAAPIDVRDFDVFVDPPTAFVFVKLPQGWKFVGKLDAKALAALPAKVRTSLLSPDSNEQTASGERTAKLAE